MAEKEREQKKGLLGAVMGSILLIIGIIVLGLGINLILNTIAGDDLQRAEYNIFSSLMVLLGIYISLFGLQFLFQKFSKSYTPRKNLVYVNVVMMIIITFFILYFVFLGCGRSCLNPI